MQYISEILLLFLVIIGAIDIIRALAVRLMMPKSGTNIIVTVPIHGHREDAEYLIRGAVLSAKWMGHKNIQVSVIDCGADEETKELCNRMCKQMGLRSVIKKEDFEIEKTLGQKG